MGAKKMALSGRNGLRMGWKVWDEKRNKRGDCRGGAGTPGCQVSYEPRLRPLSFLEVSEGQHVVAQSWALAVFFNFFNNK